MNLTQIHARIIQNNRKAIYVFPTITIFPVIHGYCYFSRVWWHNWSSEDYRTSFFREVALTITSYLTLEISISPL